MARVEIPVVVTDPVTGKAIQGATVQVNRRSDGTGATVYADETSGATVANPLTSDVNGNVTGWVPRGAYNLVVTAPSYATRTVAWDAVPGSDAGIDSGALASGTVPTGVLQEWPYSEAAVPAGWLICYGQAVSRTTYAALHALAATSGYPDGNGDGATTFNLPDFRGRLALGKDDMGGVAAGRVTSGGSGIAATTLGASGGAETVALSTAQLPVHGHGVSGTPGRTGGVALTGAPARAGSITLGGAPGITDPGHFHTVTAVPGTQVNSAGGGGLTPLAAAAITSDTKTTGITATIGTLALTDTLTVGIGTLAVTDTIAVTAGSLAVGNAGSGGSHTNMPPVRVVNKIIKT